MTTIKPNQVWNFRTLLNCNEVLVVKSINGKRCNLRYFNNPLIETWDYSETMLKTPNHYTLLDECVKRYTIRKLQ